MKSRYALINGGEVVHRRFVENVSLIPVTTSGHWRLYRVPQLATGASGGPSVSLTPNDGCHLGGQTECVSTSNSLDAQFGPEIFGLAIRHEGGSTPASGLPGSQPFAQMVCPAQRERDLTSLDRAVRRTSEQEPVGGGIVVVVAKGDLGR